MAFSPAYDEKTARKTTVSAVIRDEKRAAQLDADEPQQRETEIVRLPRFLQERSMTGAQIGTAFHRMMRMIDLNRLRASTNMAAEIARQLNEMLESGVVTRAEFDAVPVRMLTTFFASPLGVRLLQSGRVEREWAFTYRRALEGGQTQLVQGIIDCCFEEQGKWVLVDYKTDSPADVPGAIKKHRPQLAIYADALERITKMPVRERVLYLVRACAGYPV